MKRRYIIIGVAIALVLLITTAVVLGITLSGSSEEKEPVDGGFSLWSNACPVTCGGSRQHRNRSCDNPAPKHNGKHCEGNFTESQICSDVQCPANGNWSEWGTWGSCTGPCDRGSQSRNRTCNNPAPGPGGADCNPPRTESRTCVAAELCPVDGKWSDWLNWSDCSITCGGGIQTRTRPCDNPAPDHGGEDCPLAATETQPCGTDTCPTNGNWGEWANWSDCTVICGGGTQSRSRQCDSPLPTDGGDDCDPPGSQTQPCGTEACPIHGNWGNWEGWDTCSVSCGGGTQSRTRVCNNPAPDHGGNACAEPGTETQDCGTDDCPIHGNWGAWNNWGSCSVTCGGGTQSRDRSCNDPQPAHGGDDCTPPGADSQDCGAVPCLGWGDWGQWVSSGSLENVRYREQSCIDINTLNGFSAAECDNQLGAGQQLLATEIKNAFALPWTESSSPGPGGDCLVNCVSNCPAIAYNPTEDMCYTGAWDSSSPIPLRAGASEAWTLTVVEQGQRSTWQLDTEVSNVLTLGSHCMTNVVLSHKKTELHMGDAVTALNPGGTADNSYVQVWAYFKESEKFLYCGDYHCYTWQFGQPGWTTSFTSEKYLRSATETFVDEEETKLIIVGGRFSPAENMRGATHSQFLSMAKGFEAGPDILHPAINIGLVMLPGNLLLYCGGYSYGSASACQIHSLSTGSNQEADSLPVYQYLFKMALLQEASGDSVVIATSGADHFRLEAYRYDIGLDKWSTIGGAQMPYAIVGSNSMFVMENRLYGYWLKRDNWSGPITSDEVVFDPELPGWSVQGTVEGDSCAGRHTRYQFQALIKV